MRLNAYLRRSCPGREHGAPSPRLMRTHHSAPLCAFTQGNRSSGMRPRESLRIAVQHLLHDLLQPLERNPVALLERQGVVRAFEHH